MRNKRRRHYLPWHSIGNRRIRPGYRRGEWHHLDVKVDSRKSRRMRKMRQAAGLIKVLAIVFSILTLTASVRWVYRAVFFGNEEFRLSRLQVQTDGVMTEAELAAAGEIHLGMNLLAIDLRDLQKRITDLPMVKSAKVSRELPDKLMIQVNERVPVAWLSCPPHGVKPRNTARGYLVDEEGQVFRCHKLLNRFVNLPVIETYHLSRPADGIQLESESVLRAIHLIAGSHRLFEPEGIVLDEVKLKSSYALVCSYSNGMEVVFGTKDYERGLEDLRRIVNHTHAAGKKLATANVMPLKNIPVTFRSAPEIRALPVNNRVADESKATLRPVAADSRRAKQLRSILNGG